jgi:UDP-N-acetylglucosamine acyltransferase
MNRNAIWLFCSTYTMPAPSVDSRDRSTIGGENFATGAFSQDPATARSPAIDMPAVRIRGAREPVWPVKRLRGDAVRSLNVSAPIGARIHPRAEVEPGAVIGDGAVVGPYCMIGRNVIIGDDCHLAGHVHVTGHTTIGARTTVSPFASLGERPQSSSYRGGATRLVIGADCDIRQNVTMSTGTEDGGGLTEVKDRGLFMANSHVGHDCRVGSDVVMANCAALGGHCIVGDHVFIGALSGVHQHARIGPHAMIGGASGVREDVIPFGLVAGAFARLSGVNAVGMRRRKFSAETIRMVRAAYRLLFLGDGVLADRLDGAEAKYGADESVMQIVTFIRDKGRRPICQAGRDQRS